MSVMSRKFVQIKMEWTLVVCVLFAEVLANGNITDHSAVLKTEIPPLVFPNNLAINVNQTAREIMQKTADVTETAMPSHYNLTEPLHKEENITVVEANPRMGIDSKVPRVFPSNSSIVLIPPANMSVLQKLFADAAAHAAKHRDENDPIVPTENNILLNSTTIPSNTATEKQKHNPKEDSEWIQVRGENSEDELHPSPGRKDMMGPQRDHGPGVPLVRGQLAAILAGIFVILAVGGYIALLSWRRYLENRYGNREMLVNEEEMTEATDMNYFSVSKL